MEIQQTKTKFEVVSSGRVMCDELIKKQEARVNQQVVKKESMVYATSQVGIVGYEDAVDTLKLLHLVKLLLSMAS